MPESQTLEFDNARAVQALFANDVRLLKGLEEQLGVRVTTRDGWIRIDGEQDRIAKAKGVFEQLEAARQSGVSIHKHEFETALRAAADSNGERLNDLVDTKIVCSNRRPPIVPKTAGQRAYIRAIRTSDLVFGVGPAGTGKTYLAMAMAIAALKKEQVKRIILTRPAVEAGEALGFLPGDLNDKIMPYLRPLYDALHDMLDPEDIERYVDRKIIEIAPLAYMRGRTLSHAFIVLDEAQNTTTEQMLMFLTRMGEDSKCVITGDPSQIDLPPKKRSGLVEALQALKDVEPISFCFFEERDVIRHELVRAIVHAYKRHRGAGEEAKFSRGNAT